MCLLSCPMTFIICGLAKNDVDTHNFARLDQAKNSLVTFIFPHLSQKCKHFQIIAIFSNLKFCLYHSVFNYLQVPPIDLPSTV